MGVSEAMGPAFTHWLTSATTELLMPQSTDEAKIGTTLFDSYPRQTPFIGKYTEVIYLWSLL